MLPLGDIFNRIDAVIEAQCEAENTGTSMSPDPQHDQVHAVVDLSHALYRYSSPD